MRSVVVISCLLGMLLGIAPAAQAGVLEQGAFLAGAAGYPVPAGWTVKFGSTADGQPAQTLHECKTININKNTVDAAGWDLSANGAELPGVIAVLIIHEVQHANDDTTNNKCDEISIQAETAGANCTIAAESVPGSTAHQNMCAFHEGHRDLFNDPNGKMQDAWDGGLFGIGACSGSFPTIPPCEACEGEG